MQAGTPIHVAALAVLRACNVATGVMHWCHVPVCVTYLRPGASLQHIDRVPHVSCLSTCRGGAQKDTGDHECGWIDA